MKFKLNNHRDEYDMKRLVKIIKYKQNNVGPQTKEILNWIRNDFLFEYKRKRGTVTIFI